MAQFTTLQFLDQADNMLVGTRFRVNQLVGIKRSNTMFAFRPFGDDQKRLYTYIMLRLRRVGINTELA